MAKPFSDQLPVERTESQISDLKPLYSDLQAIAEANRCLYCYDAPCIQACPTDINIPEFIRRIATKNTKGSGKTILDSNILGLSCASACPVEVLCEGSCVYNNTQVKPIEIGRLQRYSTEYIYQNDVKLYKKGPSTGKKVALIGAGPASLACAAELAIQGHDPVIFERNSLPGGLNTTGIAPYKMRAETSLREVAYIQDIGVEIQTGVEIGKNKTLDELESEFDAVFIGVGLGPDSQMNIPGEDLPHCHGALEVIEKIKLTVFDISNYQHAVVVGGGNTALDAVRELKKIGVPKVTMVYRRTEAEMSGYKHELDYAKKEGVTLSVLTQPIAILGDDKVTGVRCVKMELTEPDDSGRRRPVAIEGSEFELKADLVAMATGQEKLSQFLGAIPNLTFEWGKVTINEQGQTSNPKYFAGGDCVNGGKEVVNAAAAGKLAAQGIDQYLKGDA